MHWADSSNGTGLVVTHGAGSNATSAWLCELADAFAAAGFPALRCDLPYRQARRTDPPRPAEAARDRLGLAAAAAWMRAQGVERMLLGGHSYGGRQASMLAAEQPNLAAGLVLCSYPLHPPGRPEQLRTAHLGEIRVPCLVVHGTKDTFGSPEELSHAFAAVPGGVRFLQVDRAAHDLKTPAGFGVLAGRVAAAAIEQFLR